MTAETHPDRARIEALIACCEKRATRAAERMAASQLEQDDAADALTTAHAKLQGWITANPDPQMELI